jgi:glycosyltransferase involved in cell wall biosynthesis
MPITTDNTFQVSVVMPVHNHPELLEKHLSSLSSQDFSLKDFEILVCDDGSTEDIQSVVEKFRGILNVRLLRQQQKGPAAARNLGIKKSTTPIIVFLDSDVLADQTLISRLVTALDQNEEWVGAEACNKPIGGDEGPLWDSPVCHDGGRYHTAAIAYRRDALFKAGGLDETFKMPACEDVDLAVQVLKEGPIGFVPDAIAKHPWRRDQSGIHPIIATKKYETIRPGVIRGKR